jgi:hypothetical protein
MLDSKNHGVFWVDLLTPSAEEEKAAERFGKDVPPLERRPSAAFHRLSSVT